MYSSPLPPIEYITPTSDLGTSLRNVWNKNVAILFAQYGDRFLQGCTDPLAAGRLFRDARHHYGISSPTPDESNSTKQLLTDFSLAEDIQSQFLDLIKNSASESVFFLGLGIGEPLLGLLSFMAERTPVVAGARKIHLIEPDPDRLHSAFYFFDYSSVLSSPLCRLHSGPGWLQLLEGELRKYSPSSAILTVHPVFTNQKVINEFVELFRKNGILPDIRNIRKDRPTEVPDSAAGYPIALGDPGTHEDLRSTFQRNLHLLQSSTDFHCPKGFLERVSNCRLDVIRDLGGRIFFPVTQPGSPPQSLALTPDELEMRHYDKTLSEQNSTELTWLQLGCGDGRLLDLLIRKTVFTGQWEGYQQIIYLIEPHTPLFAAFLHFFDLKEILSIKRLKIFAGEEAQSLLLKYLREVSESRIPDRFILSPHFLAEELEKYKNLLFRLQEEIANEAQELSRKLAELYDQKPLSYWRKRFNGKKPLTVVGLTTRMSSYVQYCLRDLIDGFAQNGQKVSLLTEKDALSSLRFNDVLRRLIELKPDLLCVIGHLRQEFQLLPVNFPYFCWIQDMLPAVSQYRGFFLNDTWDHIYSINKIWAKNLKKKNQTFLDTSIGVLPIGFNETYFHPLPALSKKYDITYITHLFDLKKTFAYLRDGYSPLELDAAEQSFIASGVITYQGLLDIYSIIAHSLNQKPLRELTEFVTYTKCIVINFFNEIVKQTKIAIPEELVSHFSEGYSRLFFDVMVSIKTRPMRSLKTHGFNVAVWGNNWDLIDSFRKVSHGIATNYDQVNQIQNQSRINLNNSGGVSFHMKAIEIMASSNFMLSRYIQNDGHPLTDYFKIDEEVVFFHDESDLVKIASYYLEHPDKRNRIAQNAYEKALQLFGYRSLAKRITDNMTNTFDKNTRS